MPLRTIAPLDEHDYNILVTDLEKGPSKKQRKFVCMACENAR